MVLDTNAKMNDYYKTLGVARTASEAEIQKAYRDLARKYHPDMNPNDAKAKAKFQEVQQAYDVLRDAERREKYDRYGTSYEQMEGGSAYGNAQFNEIDISELFGGRGGSGGEAFGFGDIFRQFAGGAGPQPGARRGRQMPRRGENLRHEVRVPFVKAVAGGKAHVAVRRGDGKVETLEVSIPAGIADGEKMKLRGQGQPSPNGGESGDLVITVRVEPHAHFERSGNNLSLHLPITLAEAAAGAKVDVPTPHGTASVTIPKNASSGKRLRLKGQGVRSKSGTGDLLVELQIVLPDDLSDEDTKKLQEVSKRYTQTPRREIRW